MKINIRKLHIEVAPVLNWEYSFPMRLQLMPMICCDVRFGERIIYCFDVRNDGLLRQLEDNGVRWRIRILPPGMVARLLGKKASPEHLKVMLLRDEMARHGMRPILDMKSVADMIPLKCR